jgi:ribosomal protein S18 acetylase RimI-like enzyme
VPPATPSITRRRIGATDEEFLVALYRSTRESELALVNWDDGQKAAFIQQQFDAQHRYYQQVYPDGSFEVILAGGQAAGRLYLATEPDDTLIIDVAMLPRFQNQGIGTALVTEVLADAATRGASVTIHVERNNPALRWYGRLGFRPVEDQGVYLLLRHPAAQKG